MPETLTATTHVGITRLAGQIGAEITGADTGTPLSDEVVARIRQALLDHKVVFLRGQSLNYRRQVAFAERLGPLTLGHPTLASPPGQPLLEEIDSLKGGKVNYWHTDVTFVDRPPAFTLLHAVVIPPLGGDTDLGQHGLGLPEPARRTARPGRPAQGRAHQRLRLRPHHHQGRTGGPRRRSSPQRVHLYRLRDRAPAGARPPGHQRTLPRPRRLRPHRAGVHPAGVGT